VSVDKLIMKFSTQEDVPVQVEDVVAQVKALGVTDEIRFFDVDADKNVLLGEIEQWQELAPPSEAAPRRFANINTPKTLTAREKRLIQCKELLHVLEPDHWRVNTHDHTVALIDTIVIPLAAQAPDEGIQATSDRIALYQAVAILFPMAVRNLLLPSFKDGRVSLEQIADHVELPTLYVALVMSDHWADALHRMVRPQRIAGPDRVSSLKADHSPIEVHSVPIGTDPYSYAKHLEERGRKADRPIHAFLIETDGGNRQTVTATQIASYSPKNEKA